ncbi:MAG: PAS domain-containing protein, partial [Bryobacteraceae bacterium]
MSDLSPDADLLIAAFQALPIAVVTADVRGIVRSVNAALTSLTGYAAAEAVGQSIARFLFTKAERSFYDILQKVVRSREPWRGEWACRRSTGDIFAAEQTVTPLESPSAEILGVVVTIQDVAARIDLFASEARRDFERFFNLIPDLACIVSADGHFKKVNPAWETTLGYTREEVLRRPMLEFIHPDDLERSVNEIAKQSPEYKTRHFVNRYRCKDGSYRIFDWRTTFHRDDLTRFGIAKDIT